MIADGKEIFLKWNVLGSESDYSAEDDDDEDFEDEESVSGMKDFYIGKKMNFVVVI
jgi:hypothetical protein